MPLSPEDYGFHRSEIVPGEVELRWRPENLGPASWAALGIVAVGSSFLVLGSAPLLLPAVPLGLGLLLRRLRREQVLRLTPQHLKVADGIWPWNELSEVAVEQACQTNGNRRGLRLALREEQAKNSFRVVVYRGPKAIVVARNLGVRRAAYLSELIQTWAAPGTEDAVTNV